jgi:hypothetical protein
MDGPEGPIPLWVSPFQFSQHLREILSQSLVHLLPDMKIIVMLDLTEKYMLDVQFGNGKTSLVT